MLLVSAFDAHDWNELTGTNRDISTLCIPNRSPIRYHLAMPRSAKLALATLLLATALLFVRRVSAHHSFASTYSDQTITIEGKVDEFLYRNPHSAVLLEAPGKNGQTVVWAAEWSTAGQLSRQGIEKDMIKPGDHLILSGNPSRNPSDHRLRISAITRPSDGWKWKSSY
ncbi:MAG TPA: DUF6152 family protein [Terriglobales bacterium]|nr:DUF6152 family protein [Terriglobales bacterium]